MGRGRAKAKQTKVARELKYSSGGTDLDALRKELTSGSATPAGGSSSAPDDELDELDDDTGDDSDDDADDTDDADEDDLDDTYGASGSR